MEGALSDLWGEAMCICGEKMTLAGGLGKWGSPGSSAGHDPDWTVPPTAQTRGPARDPATDSPSEGAQAQVLSADKGDDPGSAGFRFLRGCHTIITLGERLNNY